MISTWRTRLKRQPDDPGVRPVNQTKTRGSIMWLYTTILIAGIVIGWNLPQPEIAKKAQAFIMEKLGF